MTVGKKLGDEILKLNGKQGSLETGAKACGMGNKQVKKSLEDAGGKQ